MIPDGSHYTISVQAPDVHIITRWCMYSTVRIYLYHHYKERGTLFKNNKTLCLCSRTAAYIGSRKGGGQKGAKLSHPLVYHAT